MTDLPATIPLATVTGWLTQTIADSLSDSDQSPEMIAMAGTVTFIPNVTRARVATGLPIAMTVFPRPIVCTLDFEGYLTSPDGNRSVTLIATGDVVPSYTVKYNLLDVAEFEIVLLIPAGPDIDLSTALEVPLAATPAADAWSAIVAQITAQADRAVTASIDASNSVDSVPALVIATIAADGTVAAAAAAAAAKAADAAAIAAVQPAIHDPLVQALIDNALSAVRAALYRATTGEQAITHAWLGTPHASTSKRMLDGGTAQTNLATNPSFETAGTSGAVRTNYSVNPDMNNLTSGWSVAGTGITMTPSAAGTIIDFPNGSTAGAAIFYQTVGVNTVPGDVWSSSLEVTVPTGYPPVFAGLSIRQYGGAAPDAQGTSLTITDAGSQRITTAAMVVPASVTQVRTLLYTGTLPAGARMIVRRSMLSMTEVPEEYFSGATLSTNLATNPRGTASGGSYSPNSALVTSRTAGVPITGHPAGIVTAVSSSCVSGSGATTLLSMYNIDGLLNKAAPRWFGGWVKVTAAGYKAYWNHDGIGLATPLTKDVWAFVASKTKLPGATHSGFAIVTDDGRVAPAEDVAYLAGVVARENTPVFQFYDKDRQDFTYGWSGAANASTSVQSAATVATVTVGNGLAVRSVERASRGAVSLRVVANTSSTSTSAIASVPLTPGKTYTALATMYLPAPLTGTLGSYAGRMSLVQTGISTLLSPQLPNVAGEATIRWTFTVDPAATTLTFRLGHGGSIGSGDVFWDDLLIVEGTYTGPYFDGGTPSKRITEAFDARYAPIALAARQLIGTGSPLGVVSAPVGTEYIDTAQTMGARKWLKTSGTGLTGWEVTVGDTGWRNISSLVLSANGYTGGTVMMARVGSTVFFTTYGLTRAAAGSGYQAVLNLPSGFGSAQSAYVRGLTSTYGYASGTVLTLMSPSTSESLSATWGTSTPWPTTLPGIPA